MILIIFIFWEKSSYDPNPNHGNCQLIPNLELINGKACPSSKGHVSRVYEAFPKRPQL